MELDEVVQRVLRRYGLLLFFAVAAALLITYTVAGRVAPTYTATARVQLTAAAPQSTATADALVSQARAVVSTQSAVAKALDAAGVRRDYLVFVGNDLTVAGLGGSSTIDVSVSDNDPVVAQRIVTSLVDQLVQSTNDIRLGNLPDMIKSVDEQLKQLALQQAPIAAKAQAEPRDPVAQNRLAGINRVINDLQATRNQLTVQSAANGLATLIDPARVPTQPQRSRLPVIMLVVGLVAAIAGLLVVSLIETLRPHMSGISRISRFLGTQPLGHVLVGAEGLLLKHGLVRRVRLATLRAGEAVVVVISTGKVPAADRIIAQLDAELDGTIRSLSSPHLAHARTIDVTSARQSQAPTAERTTGSTTGSAVGGTTVESRESDAPLGPSLGLLDLALASVSVANGTDRSGGPSAGSRNLAEAESRGRDADELATTGSTTGPTAGWREGPGGRDAERHGSARRRVIGLDELGAEDPHGAAVIALTRTFVARSQLDEVSDFLEITGWPLLGVVSVSRSRKFWQRLPRLRTSPRARHPAPAAHGPVAAEPAQRDQGDAGTPVHRDGEAPEPTPGPQQEGSAADGRSAEGDVRSGSTADSSPGGSPGSPAQASPRDTSPGAAAPIDATGGPASRGSWERSAPFEPIVRSGSRGPQAGADVTEQPGPPSQSDGPHPSKDPGTEPR